MSQYESFSSYQKGLINEESLGKYKTYAEKYQELTSVEAE